ncbi:MULTISPECIES: hypothetical protein [Streptomyces]|uniref:hypothetical protein n=1 Tax=Streptomyces TaxID=1883 RepID=UPI0015C4EC36|nr:MULTISPECIES: hypothetical protein [Streptomyces]MDX3587196.1 hypothetical protein [Streptomyces europaeiscabiei]MDX3611778.1 hypothetical protein [Streptomyces europaeiscabiei]MDX3636782.1 hypothetical protein [Streptomyces europaeiscabiei]MDX3650245.1 hypothetical protein [Streptomyces europaeiscabiei]WUD37819.1 hypothetical protein OG858_44705 [Streptomyces europaeiscabiei]
MSESPSPSELPKDDEIVGGEDLWSRATVDFRSQRVTDHELSEPSAPQVFRSPTP